MTNLPHQKAKRRKTFKRILLVCLLAAIFYFAVFLTAIHFTGTQDGTRPADVIIVLGAGLRHDGRPGPALTRRSIRAADLWQRGIAPIVLCTGGQAESFPRSEAGACHEILRGRGLPQSAILLEENSRSTEENALFSSQIIRERGWTSAALVSDSYHMLRANWLFRSHGVEPFASPVPANRNRYPLNYPYSLLREFLAFHWHVLKEALNIPVTHLSGL